MEFSELAEGHKVNVSHHARQLMRALVDAFGEEHGYSLYDKINSVVGEDFRCYLTLEMLKGTTTEHTSFVIMRPMASVKIPSGCAVPIIKAIRQHTGYGLKEAKDVYDGLNSGKDQRIEITGDYRTVVNDLVHVGIPRSYFV